MLTARHRTFALLALALLLTPGAAPGDETIAGAALSVPPAGRESGRSLYERFLDQRLRESFQRLRVISKDPGGSALTTGFTISTQDHRDANHKATQGILAKVLIEVFDPFDLRHTLYLIISKNPGPDDEFIYRPSANNVKRTDLKNTSLLGTDYTFNDIVYQNLDDADYVRLDDEVVDEKPVYVVEVNVKEEIDVQFHRTMVYLDQEHLVALRLRYWDDYGVEIKEMTSPASTIRAFGDTWVATESTMRDLRQGTTSTMIIDELDTTPNFPQKTFSIGTLYKGR